MRCGCPWRINFFRHVNGNYVFASTRYLQHARHECVPPEQLAVTIDSLRVMPDAVVRDVRIAVRHEQRGLEPLRRQLAERYELDIDRRTFPDLVQRSKLELGIQDGMDVSVPSFSSTVSAPSANMPSRQAMCGQLVVGAARCWRGCQPSMYRCVSGKLQSLCKDVEAQVASDACATGACCSQVCCALVIVGAAP